jgi:hypothetical protein
MKGEGMGDRHNDEDDRPEIDLGEVPDARLSAPGVEITDDEPVPAPADVPVVPRQAAAPEREITRVERDLKAHDAKTSSGARSGSWWRRLWKRA